MKEGFRLAVVIPCRDERAVLGRKLRNTLGLDFPGSGPHRVIVVDDHSRDGSVDGQARVATEDRGEAGNGTRVEVVAVRSDRFPGKAGALAAGLEAAAGFDAAVITDADVLLDRGALRRLAETLEDDGVGLASGEPRYVERIADDAVEGIREGLYDRITRAVRRAESRRGFVFSVHGECLALRPRDGLLPEPGLASDDTDLALAARRRGMRVLLAEGARFFEERPSSLGGRRTQDLRRARSFVQFVARRRGTLVDPAFSLRDRIALLPYFSLPLAAPVSLLGLAGAFLAATLSIEGTARFLPAGALLLLAALPPVRDLLRRLFLVTRAAAEYAAGVRATDRWEPVR